MALSQPEIGDGEDTSTNAVDIPRSDDETGALTRRQRLLQDDLWEEAVAELICTD